MQPQPTLVDTPGRLKIIEILLEKAHGDIEHLELNTEGAMRDQLGEIGMLVALASDELADLRRQV